MWENMCRAHAPMCMQQFNVQHTCWIDSRTMLNSTIGRQQWWWRVPHDAEMSSLSPGHWVCFVILRWIFLHLSNQLFTNIFHDCSGKNLTLVQTTHASDTHVICTVTGCKYYPDWSTAFIMLLYIVFLGDIIAFRSISILMISGGSEHHCHYCMKCDYITPLLP